MVRISKTLFSEDGEKLIYEYKLKNANGVEVHCLNFGCAITKIITPDRHRSFENIALGYQDFANYQNNRIYAGVIAGRVAGRIKNAEFELEGKPYCLTSNDGKHHLHGGLKGFHHVIWDEEIVEQEKEAVLKFSYISLDGEEGYPGTLKMTVTYSLNDKNELIIHYQGKSDQATLLNPTSHTYFNLSGNLKRDTTEHILTIDSDNFLELAEDLLPTGKLLDVSSTVFDFRGGRKIIEGINSDATQNKLAGQGYDHPFVLNSHNNQEIILYDEESGRRLIIETDAVGVVLYTGNHIPSDLDFGSVRSGPYLGVCLETQGLPDSIHHPQFPSCVLAKDENFSTVTKYTFDVMA